MASHDIPRFPHFGRLSLAILEHLVKPVVGDQALGEIKAPVLAKEQQEKLASTLVTAEKRFTTEHADSELCQAILNLPLADLPAVQQAVSAFYARPADTAFSRLLRDRLTADYPRLPAERIDSAVSVYLTILRQELVNVSEEIRDKLNTLATLAIQIDTAKIAEGMNKLVDAMTRSHQLVPRPGSAPPLPSLIIGREEALRDLKTRLGISAGGVASTAPMQVLTAVRGWPGVGKTTVAAALAHDQEVASTFPDGVLWTSLGPTPSLPSELAAWGRALGTEDLLRARDLKEASAQLTALLRNKRMLLIVDDVWEPEHAIPFMVGGRSSALLITTRVNSVAQALAPTPDAIYKLAVLTDEKALELLQAIAPTVVAQHPQSSLELAHDLEGLPLALQVAGRLLNVEAGYGFGVTQLITELREGAKLIEATAPADRADLVNETIPTVAVLLQKSTERLDPLTLDCFAYLGAFAPKPAMFDLLAMKAVWQVEDPKPIARTLVDRGLLEYLVEVDRYQMHALLVMHAKSFLTED